MGRSRNPTETLASTYVTLRSAGSGDPAALRAAVDSATAELERALSQRKHFSKAEAAGLLEVSAPTLDKWVSSGLLPVVEAPEYRRPRVPAQALLALAAEVKELRRMGQKRGLLAEALARLEEEDPSWRAEFQQLYGGGAGRGHDFVSAAPGPDWHPED